MENKLDDLYAADADSVLKWVEANFWMCKFCHRFFNRKDLREIGRHWDTGVMEHACDSCAQY